jgi:hypothetical protein
MSKRRIEIDGEVKLVSFSEWRKITEQGGVEFKNTNFTKKKSKDKLKIKDVQVENDPSDSEPTKQDQNNSEE